MVRKVEALDGHIEGLSNNIGTYDIRVNSPEGQVASLLTGGKSPQKIMPLARIDGTQRQKLPAVVITRSPASAKGKKGLISEPVPDAVRTEGRSPDLSETNVRPQVSDVKRQANTAALFQARVTPDSVAKCRCRSPGDRGPSRRPERGTCRHYPGAPQPK